MTHPAQPKASHYINGEYVEDTSGAEIPVIYPATGEVIAEAGKKITPRVVKKLIDEGNVTSRSSRSSFLSGGVSSSWSSDSSYRFCVVDET